MKVLTWDCHKCGWRGTSDQQKEVNGHAACPQCGMTGEWRRANDVERGEGETVEDALARTNAVLDHVITITRAGSVEGQWRRLRKKNGRVPWEQVKPDVATA